MIAIRQSLFSWDFIQFVLFLHCRILWHVSCQVLVFILILGNSFEMERYSSFGIIKTWVQHGSLRGGWTHRGSTLTPRSQHYATKYHFFKSHVWTPAGKKSILHIQKIGTKDQIVDIFTKPLAKGTFQAVRWMLQREYYSMCPCHNTATPQEWHWTQIGHIVNKRRFSTGSWQETKH